MKVQATWRWWAVAAAAWSFAPAAAYAVASSADSEIADVAIMVTRPEDRTLAQTGVRLQRELRASGLDSHFATCQTPDAWEDTPCGAPPPLTDQGWGQPPGATNTGGAIGARRQLAGSLLAIFLGREKDVITIEVIAKLTDGWKPFRQVYVPPNLGGNDSSVLAMRAVEMVRDIRLDIQRWQAARQVPVTEKITEEPAAPPPLPFHNWRLTAAASVLQGRRGLGASVAPALGIAGDWGAHFSLLATLAGPFYKELSASTLGTANTRQEFALLGGRYAFGERRARPFVGVATGVYHLLATTGASADGDAGTPAVALWAPFASAGGGVSVSITQWLALMAQADVLMTAPAGDVTLGSTVVGRAGGPSFLIQTGACFSL